VTFSAGPRSILIGVALSGLLCAALPSEAEPTYSICSMDRQQFLDLAFVSEMPTLAKWPQPPTFVVLSPSDRIANEVTLAFDAIKADDVPGGAYRFETYRTASDLQSIVERRGQSVAYVIIDNAAFASAEDYAELKRTVGSILASEELAQELVDAAHRDGEAAVKVDVDPDSSQVRAAVAFVNPIIDSRSIATAIYSMYYVTLAPIAATRPAFSPAILALEKDESGPRWKLTDEGHAFFRILLDSAVFAGMRPDQFAECAS
jgi:hypothetical protein